MQRCYGMDDSFLRIQQVNLSVQRWLSSAGIEAVTAAIGRVLDLEMVSPLLDTPAPLFFPACCAECLRGKPNRYAMVDCLVDRGVALELEAKIGCLNGLIEAHIGGKANLASCDCQYPIFPLPLGTKSAHQMVDIVGCGDTLG